MGIDWRANALRCCLWRTSNAKLTGAGRGDRGVWSWQGNSAADGGGEEVGSDDIPLNLFTNIRCEGVSEHAT